MPGEIGAPAAFPADRVAPEESIVIVQFASRSTAEAAAVPVSLTQPLAQSVVQEAAAGHSGEAGRAVRRLVVLDTGE